MTRVATVQAEPVWIDAEATLDKTLTLMEQAADAGATTVVFPELWNPGHPVFLSTHDEGAQSPFRARYRSESLIVGGPVLQTVSRAARELSLVVALGFSERHGERLYSAIQVIDADGRVVLHHRRSRLTEAEATLFMFGRDTTTSVRSLGGGLSLISYEDTAPVRPEEPPPGLESDLHVAMLPCLGLQQPDDDHPDAAPSPTSLMSALRAHAFHNVRHVAVASQVIGERGAQVFSTGGGRSPVVVGGGGFARVYGPTGEQLTRALDPDRNGIVWADLQRPWVRHPRPSGL